MTRPLTPDDLANVQAMASELMAAEGLDREAAYDAAMALVLEGALDLDAVVAPRQPLPALVVEYGQDGSVQLCRGPFRFTVFYQELPQLVDSLITLAERQDELDELRAKPALSGLAKAA